MSQSDNRTHREPQGTKNLTVVDTTNDILATISARRKITRSFPACHELWVEGDKMKRGETDEQIDWNGKACWSAYQWIHSPKRPRPTGITRIYLNNCKARCSDRVIPLIEAAIKEMEGHSDELPHQA